MGKPEGPRNDRKKLSWTYRNKKRQGKINKPQNALDENVQVQNKKARIIIRNLSFKVTEDDIRNLYAPYGPIEQIDLLKRPDGKPVGCGFVQFKRIEDASKAIFNTNKQEFLGRVINSAWAIPKAKFVEQLQKSNGETQENNEKEEEVEIDNDEAKEETNSVSNNIKRNISDNKKQRVERKKLTPEERKALKLRKRQKRARIVIRNLSFKVNEDILREHFIKYGTIDDIQILKKSDGKRVGCAFVQFQDVQSAAKAVHYANMKPICERPVVVDFAVPKSKFASNNSNNNTEIKEESEDIKPELEILDNSQTENEIKNEESHDENNDNSEESENEEEEEEDNEDNDDDDEDQEDQDIKDSSIIEHEPEKRPRVISHDVNEGKTVFLKNVPFSANNNDLKECMEQFGPVYYALVCIDPLTEHSKGTAFVKFRNVEDAEKCLSAGTELRLHDQVLDPHKALDKQNVPNGNNLKKQRVKDSRNLYLVKEGVIMAGSPAAAGISASDMAKRLQMEQWKSQMLRNLNMFVSRVRLVVHNLPPSLDDATLRTIFKNHGGPKSVITEARVMRDLRNPDPNNVGKSKEFGFVAFTTHEDALRALRSINNNPNIFSATKRPIVAFSIENRVMVNAKQRRIEKSRERNPLWMGKRKGDLNNDKSNEPPLKRPNNHSKKQQETNSQSNNNEDVEGFAGITSKPGASTKLRSKYKLKSQIELHNKVLKNEKKKKKIERVRRDQKIEQKLSRKEIKPKQGTKKLNDDAEFSNLINNYKKKLSSIVQSKSKWYDT
ncbi:hypothetical protein PV326_008385 [Microctonus aethiopoides]|nr:hypothetical protein PV326_008385 [Microctonus aethiopoides]